MAELFPHRPSDILAETQHHIYTAYWTKQVRAWDQPRRAAVEAALSARLAQPGFKTGRHAIAGLINQAHPGASLVVLHKILRAFPYMPFPDLGAPNKEI